MALYYDIQLVRQISQENLKLYIEEFSHNLTAIKISFKDKDYDQILTCAEKIDKLASIFGMEVACEEAHQVIKWTQIKGKTKEIKNTFESLRSVCKKAVKEIIKDFFE